MTVPGELTVAASTTRSARPGDLDAYIELRRGADVEANSSLGARRPPSPGEAQAWNRADTSR